MKQAKPKSYSLPRESWVGLLGADPRLWLLESDEPSARWITLTQLLDRSDSDPEVIAAHKAVLADAGTRELIEQLPAWDIDTGASGHNSPKWTPNLLLLLCDMGIQAGDDKRIEKLLDAMLKRQDPSQRFQSFGKLRGIAEPLWGALLCDTHAITEVLVRFGRGDDSRVKASLNQMGLDLAKTAQGRAWPCIPEPVSGFRGPGRKSDFCPMVTLEALRTYSHLPKSERPRELLEVAGVLLRSWRMRGSEKPYMFGFGLHFKTVKWPSFWFDLHWMLDTLGRYPELQKTHQDREALAEMAACLVAYNFGKDGTVTPQSCYQGFEQFSFGQKKQPSAFATARLAVVLRRFDGLAKEIRAVDVAHLASSKGGSSHPVLPKGAVVKTSKRQVTRQRGTP